jgi:AbrB family looped-hinge helix DNA binding protein
MQITLLSKGRIVLPAHMRRRLRLRSRSILEAEERDGGIFLRAVKFSKKIEPIEYLPPGAIKLTRRDCEEMDALAGDDYPPDFE